MKVVQFNGVWEKYRIKFIQDGRVRWEEFYALEDINFEVDKGQAVGVIGDNGAGKTTLLKLIGGMLVPDRGRINVRGKVAALMELGAGFNPEFTGRENIVLNARMYGLDEHSTKRQMEKIIEFAGLGKFIDAPIKYYSQGMYMRLAFALAIYVEPDILLIDDILAVGDQEAQQKCIRKIFELKQAGTTIIVVSHDMNMINKLCDRAVLLDKGRIAYANSPQELIPRYLEIAGDKKGIAILEKQGLRVVFNNGRIIIGYAGEPITNKSGGYVSFLNPYLNSWLFSFNLDWQIETSFSDKIVAGGRSQEGELSQIWTLELRDEYLHWTVEMKQKDIREPHLHLTFVPQYNEWLTLDKKDKFPLFTHRLNRHDLGLDNLPGGLLGLSPGLGGIKVPNLILETADGEQNGQVKLFNSGYEESRIFQAYLKNNSIAMKVKLFPVGNDYENYIQNIRQLYFLKQKEQRSRMCVSQSISSDKLHLFADLEKKAIRLYYNGKEITRGACLHSYFLIEKKWYDITSSQWRIIKEKDSLLIEFFWKALKLTQAWRFFLKESDLIWKIQIFANGPLDLEVIKFGIFLSGDYRSFFCGCQQLDFPKQFNVGQDMRLANPKAKLFGLRKENDLPAIIFKNEQGANCIIQHRDSAFSFRSLQLCLSKDMLKDKNNLSLAATMSLLEDESPIDSYIKQGKENLAISAGRLSLFVDLGDNERNKAIRLYYDGKELTKGRGLSASFCVGSSRFTLDDAYLEVEKISERELILIFGYESLALSQIWTLFCKDENTLEIKIEVEVKQQVLLSNQEIRLEFQDKYRDWLTAYEQGDFSAIRYVNNIAPIRLKENKVSQVILQSDSSAHSLPKLFFESASRLNSRSLYIYKGRQEMEEYICLNFSSLASKAEGVLKPGRHNYCGGRIVLNKDIKLQKKPASSRSIALRKGKLELLLDQGKGRIFWGRKELTSGLGGYTSVYSAGVWYDSSQAAWRVIERKKDKIVARGDWISIPISQTWELELIKGNLIHWRIGMDIHERTTLEIEQANLMLSSEYKIWAIPGMNKAEFLEEFTQDYEIYHFRFWYGWPPKQGISVIGENLPSLFFKSDSSEDNLLKGIVENTDYLYKARLLQYQKSNAIELLPKKYTYFSGEIEIEPEE